MENSMLISVIIPAYNAEKYVAQCIENLLFQTYKKLEIIVVDDGSTDRTAEIVKQYPTVKYIHQENSGNCPGVVRNTGIVAATGEYIHFMDADDLVNLEFYEKMINAILKTQADMACCGFVFERFLNQSQKIEYSLLASTIEDKLSLTNVSNYGACWKYIYKLSFIKENKLLFEKIVTGEDRIFSIQAVFYANRIVSVPGAVYVYKNRANSITTSKKLTFVRKRHQDRRYASEVITNFATQHNFMLNKKQVYQRWNYKLLGLPIFSKRVFYNGKTKWYVLNIPVFQKK
jgi:glycosyltransferase involved in cell wall biosynthesis